MTVYADYTYYSTEFLGTAIAEADFPALAFQASAVIDAITFNRAASDTDNTNAIKNAMCAVAEELKRQVASGNVDGIASESQGRYSVSFAKNSEKMKTNQTRLEDAARVWLANTGLMFAGFYTGEYGTTLDDNS